MVEIAIGDFLDANETWEIATWGTTVPDRTAPPYCVFDVISTTEHHTHDGPTNLIRCRMQFTHIAATKAAAKANARALRALLNGRRKQVMGDIWIDGIMWDNERDLFGPNTTMFQVVQDYIIFYKERESVGD